ALADRYGAARVLMVGALLYALGTVVMAVAEAPLLFSIGGGIIIGIGIATASGSMGQFVFAPLGGALIAAYGWYDALLVLAASTLLIILFAVPLLVQNTSASKAMAGEA